MRLRSEERPTPNGDCGARLSTESVRRLFQSGAFNGGVAPAGVLADSWSGPRYESVVEDFLRDELNYAWSIVDAADEGLRLLRTDVDAARRF